MKKETYINKEYEEVCLYLYTIKKDHLVNASEN